MIIPIAAADAITGKQATNANVFISNVNDCRTFGISKEGWHRSGESRKPFFLYHRCKGRKRSAIIDFVNRTTFDGVFRYDELTNKHQLTFSLF